MSEGAGVEQPTPQGQSQGGNDPSAQSGGTGPDTQAAPYAEYLDRLPESVRPLVEPIFKEWDSGVTQKFQQVHSQYQPLKEWEPIAQEWDLETTQQALALMDAINRDPEQVYKALAESFGFGEQGQGADPTGIIDPDEELNPFADPRFKTVEEMTNAMAEIMLQQETARREAEEDAQLDRYLTKLRETHGDYDEDYVLAHMQLGMSGEQAVEKYNQMLAGMNARPSAPTVLGTGGGLPSQGINPAKLGGKETRDLVAQMLEQANRSEG